MNGMRALLKEVLALDNLVHDGYRIHASHPDNGNGPVSGRRCQCYNRFLVCHGDKDTESLPNHRTARQYRPLLHHHDTVAYNVCIKIAIFQMAAARNADIVSNTTVFVNDGILDITVFAYTCQDRKSVV